MAKNNKFSRREWAKRFLIGTSTGCLGIVNSSSAISPDDDVSTDDNTCPVYDCGVGGGNDVLTAPQRTWTEGHYLVAEYADYQICTSLSWYSSTYSESSGWIHEFGVFSSANTNDKTSIGTRKPYHKQSISTYEKTGQRTSEVEILPRKKNKFCGAYPNTSGPSIPDWVEIPAAAALTLYKPGLTFPIAAIQLVNEMNPVGGEAYDESGHGFDFKHQRDGWKEFGWKKASQFQRFYYIDSSGGNAWGGSGLATDITYQSSQETGSEFNSIDIKYDLGIFEDEQPERQDTMHHDHNFAPEKMSERTMEKFGIKKISNQTESKSDLFSKEDDLYIATDLPLSVEISTDVK